jgi:hypothetical protein
MNHYSASYRAFCSHLAPSRLFETETEAREFDRDLAVSRILFIGRDVMTKALTAGDPELAATLSFLAEEIPYVPGPPSVA